MLLRELFLTAEFFQIIQRITLPGKDPVHSNLPHHIVDFTTGKIVVLGKEHCVIFIETVQLVHPDMFLGLNAGSLELYLEKEAPLKCRIQAAFKVSCGDEYPLLLLHLLQNDVLDGVLRLVHTAMLIFQTLAENGIRLIEKQNRKIL